MTATLPDAPAAAPARDPHTFAEGDAPVTMSRARAIMLLESVEMFADIVEARTGTVDPALAKQINDLVALLTRPDDGERILARSERINLNLLDSAFRDDLDPGVMLNHMLTNARLEVGSTLYQMSDYKPVGDLEARIVVEQRARPRR